MQPTEEKLTPGTEIKVRKARAEEMEAEAKLNLSRLSPKSRMGVEQAQALKHATAANALLAGRPVAAAGMKDPPPPPPAAAGVAVPEPGAGQPAPAAPGGAADAGQVAEDTVVNQVGKIKYLANGILLKDVAEWLPGEPTSFVFGDPTKEYYKLVRGDPLWRHCSAMKLEDQEHRLKNKKQRNSHRYLVQLPGGQFGVTNRTNLTVERLGVNGETL